jgi:hypothetical protein
MINDLGTTVAGRLLGRRPTRVADHQACARMQEVAHQQADEQGDRRHRDEVEQRQPADLADLRRLPNRADAEHDRAEDDRRDHHLDQLDEPRAQRLERLTNIRGDEADHDAEYGGHNDRDVEVVGAISLLDGMLLGGDWFGHEPSVGTDSLGGGANRT